MSFSLRKVADVIITIILLGLLVACIAVPIKKQIQAQKEPIENLDFSKDLTSCATMMV